MHAIAKFRIYKYHENPRHLDPSAIPVQCITVMINYVFLSFSAVQTYDLSYTHLHSSPVSPYGYITNSQCDQLPDGLLHVAQLAEHCTNIAEVMGLNPIQA